MKNVYFTPAFPINKLTTYGEELWVHNPNSLRMKYRYLEAIIEHIQNDICEPILVTQSGDQYLPGGHGVNRLMAIIRHTEWSAFPAIVNLDTIPNFLKDKLIQINTFDDIQKFYKRDLTNCVSFSDYGVQLGTWGSFQPHELAKTFKASEKTKERIMELFAIEHLENGNLNRDGIDPELLNKWIEKWQEHRNANRR